MERRKFTREFKLEAVRLIKERRVSYVRPRTISGLHQSQLSSWVKALADDPQHAFPAKGQMKPEQLEIAQLKREVIKLKAERDILKKPRPTSRRSQREVRLHREAPGDLAGGMVVRGAMAGASIVSSRTAPFGATNLRDPRPATIKIGLPVAQSTSSVRNAR